jgi:hypothetical protein
MGRKLLIVSWAALLLPAACSGTFSATGPGDAAADVDAAQDLSPDRDAPPDSPDVPDGTDPVADPADTADGDPSADPLPDPDLVPDPEDTADIPEAADPPADETTPPACLVTVAGGRFTDCSGPLRFIGVNIRGLTHYGGGDALPYAPAADIETNLSAAQDMGVEVVRVFAAYNGIDAARTGDRLEAALGAAAAHGIRLDVALTDFYGTTPFHPAGDDGYYETDSLGYVVLNQTFFDSGYRNNYLPLVLALAGRFADNPWVFCWELGNEIKNVPDPEVFIRFAADVAAQIRAADPNHLVTGGLISTRSAAMSHDQAVRLYAVLDFITTHAYEGSDEEDDSGLAAELGLPFIVEEAGFSGDGRSGSVSGDMDKWFGRGASSYMQWGFMATGSDNGDGDRNVGMDRVFHSDWDALFAVYRDRAAVLAW